MDEYNYMPPPGYYFDPYANERPPAVENYNEMYEMDSIISEGSTIRATVNERSDDECSLSSASTGARSKASFTSRLSSSVTSILSAASSVTFSQRTLMPEYKPSLKNMFKVMYMKGFDNPDKKGSRYLLEIKERDNVDELIDNDALGCKKCIFYVSTVSIPLPTKKRSRMSPQVDRRVKVQADFIDKCYRGELGKENLPAAKLKPWELSLYQKLGFIRIV